MACCFTKFPLCWCDEVDKEAIETPDKRVKRGVLREIASILDLFGM